MAVMFSSFQQAIFSFLAGSGNLIIQAVAGSGKTFTLLECMKRLSGGSIFVAFNKSIADELAGKVPSHVTAKTIHALGLSVLRQSFGYVKVKGNKIDTLMWGIPALCFDKKSTLPKEKAVVYENRRIIKGMISICKATLTDYTSQSAVAEICDQYNIDFKPEIFGLFKSIFEKSITQTKVIDFDDMIYFPVAFNLKMPWYENVLIDECQDLNKAQIEFCLRLIKPKTGRAIAVGDSNQSIYGFRGADKLAMERIKNALNATELPLSVCYRCPTSHVKLAQEIVPHIEAAQGAVKGEINNIDISKYLDNVSPGDLTLCRVNAKLTSAALKLIAKGKQAVIRGGDLGKYLVDIVKSFNGLANMQEYFDAVDKWENKQCEMLEARRAPASTVSMFHDKADTLRVIGEACTSPSQVIEKIQSIFDDKGKGIILSTIHKAKGNQAKNIYIFNPELLPLVHKNQTEWEKEQEYNIKYVALTRATNTLNFVNS